MAIGIEYPPFDTDSCSVYGVPHISLHITPQLRQVGPVPQRQFPQRAYEDISSDTQGSSPQSPLCSPTPILSPSAYPTMPILGFMPGAQSCSVQEWTARVYPASSYPAPCPVRLYWLNAAESLHDKGRFISSFGSAEPRVLSFKPAATRS